MDMKICYWKSYCKTFPLYKLLHFKKKTAIEALSLVFLWLKNDCEEEHKGQSWYFNSLSSLFCIGFKEDR